MTRRGVTKADDEDRPISLPTPLAEKLVGAVAERGRIECCFVNGRELDGAMEVTLLVTATVPDKTLRGGHPKWAK